MLKIVISFIIIISFNKTLMHYLESVPRSYYLRIVRKGDRVCVHLTVTYYTAQEWFKVNKQQ